MLYVYDKNGKEFKMNSKIDQRSALSTGNYFVLPPGAPLPAEKPKQPEGEKVEGIVMPEPEKSPEKEPAARVIRHKKA